MPPEPFSVAVLDVAGYECLSSECATKLCAAAFSKRELEIRSMGEVSVALVGAEEIQTLNLKFRNIDTPTDVLSFEIDGPYGEMVGEVVICPECASAEMGVEELVVHGALHLSGMDHGEEFEESEMALVQAAVMETMRAEEG